MACIAGFVSQHANLDIDSTGQLHKMLRRMRHRGPDNSEVRTLYNRCGAVGANEINLSPRRTRCSSLDQAPYVLFDGELFNDRPEGMSDLDLFKEYYDRYRRGCFHRLNGSFACAIVEKDGEVVLARDHVGARPLFFGRNDSKFIFSTEMKGLVDHFQFGIEELPPGCIYSSEKGIEKFDAFQPEVPEIGASLNEAAKILRDLVIDAVRQRMDGVEAVSLSGGLDSSIVAAVAKEFNPNLTLFTGTIARSPGPDLANAKRMADFLNLEHRIYKITDADITNFIPNAIWHLESFDEDCISGLISNYYVSRLVKHHCNSVLVGEGSDELFGGYRLVLKHPSVKSAEKRVQLARKLVDIAYNTALRRLDRGWMANGVDYQVPFLDSRVVAFSQKIPMEWKIYGDTQIEKYILREAFRDMLPEQIANREKLRFSMGVGMDDIMDGIIAAIIDPEEIKKRPKTAYGMPFASFKELYYYDLFLQQFPPSYEKQTVRWDPFK
jgi:asparagine synthase (glutamine-hydrolysing)